MLAREQKFSQGTDAFHLEMSTASHATERESPGLALEQIGVRHQKGLPVEEPQKRKYRLLLPPIYRQRARPSWRPGLAGLPVALTCRKERLALAGR